jgi:6,7-dimethyl-8-ribityllumazine synthase
MLSLRSDQNYNTKSKWLPKIKTYPITIKFNPNAKNFRFGIVVSKWNDSMKVCLKALWSPFRKPSSCSAYYSLECSGSFELIYGSKKMLQTQNVDAVIAIDASFKDKPFWFCMWGVAQGIKDLNVQTDIPVIFCV